jgi:peptidyl-tRNA hydrolase
MSHHTEDLVSVEAICAMGFKQESALAAINTNPATLDEAVSWIISSGIEEDGDFSEPMESMKMVLVVRTDLSMSPGKVAAQCVHAALGAVRDSSIRNANSLQYWEETGEATICLKCDSESEMKALEEAAIALSLVTYIVCDAGRTEVAAGSQTVLAIGPYFISKIDQVTKHLKLYR